MKKLKFWLSEKGQETMGFIKHYQSIKQTLALFSKTRRDTIDCNELRRAERKKSKRTTVINTCANFLNAQNYLEIGVRNPDDNFNKVQVNTKTSVDPGLEFGENPATYPMTSDAFFELWKEKCLAPYDLIFIDGLHLAEQVSRDIRHALEMSSPNGLIMLHDCNPPNRYFARENYSEINPAKGSWNGTTYKAAWEYAFTGNFEMRIVDCDMGIGVISKMKPKSPQENPNPYFEWNRFEIIREESGLLIDEEGLMVWLNSIKK
jgi:hypothetical protein